LTEVWCRGGWLYEATSKVQVDPGFGGSLLAVADRDPELRQKISKESRLWLLSLVCASAGAVTVWATDSIGQGVLAFLVSLTILGPLLWFYEKRRR